MPDTRKTVDILISDELKEVLLVIEPASLVANLLLKKRHYSENLKDSPINYLSIAKDRSKLTYLTEDRIDPDASVDEMWGNGKKYQSKPGGIVAKLFKDVPPKEVELFSNLFRAESVKPRFNLKVVSGAEIPKYYLYETYASESGSLGISCMKHRGCQPFFNIYKDNTDNTSMLIMLDDDGYLIGRALLWEFDTYKIMDRIYTINDEKYPLHFKKWATENDYLYKTEQNWFNSLFFENLKTKKTELKICLTFTNYRYDYYPYFDTFKFLDIDNYKFYNYIPEGKNIRILCTTNGSSYDSDHLCFDDIDEVYRYRGETININYRNIRTTERNAYYSSVNETYILKEDAILDETLREYIFNEENDDKNNHENIKRCKKDIEKYNEFKEKKKCVSWGDEDFSPDVETFTRTISGLRSGRRVRPGVRVSDESEIYIDPYADVDENPCCEEVLQSGPASVGGTMSSVDEISRFLHADFFNLDDDNYRYGVANNVVEERPAVVEDRTEEVIRALEEQINTENMTETTEAERPVEEEGCSVETLFDRAISNRGRQGYYSYLNQIMRYYNIDTDSEVGGEPAEDS